MVDNIKKLTLKGGFYETPLDIDFFYKKEKKEVIKEVNIDAVLIYGDNGSGKSSIVEGIDSYVKESIESEYDVHVEFINKDVIDETNIKDNMYIYNEAFIDKEVKYASDGLDAVVMLGEQAEIDEVIKLKEDELSKNESLIYNLENYINNSEKNAKSTYKIFKAALTQDNGWADIDRLIKDNKLKSAFTIKVRDDIFLRKISPYKNNDFKKIKNDFDKEFYFYTNNRSKNLIELKMIDSWKININEIKKIKKSLLNEYRKPIETNTLDWLEEELKSRGIPFYEDVIKTMNDNNKLNCPYCLQNIDQSTKNSVLSNLNNLLDDEIKVVTKQLKSYLEILPQFNKSKIDSNYYKILGEDNKIIIEKINIEIDLFNKSILKLINKVNQKIKNPFKSLDINIDLPKNIDVNIDILNNNINIFNNKIINFNSMKNNLIEQNKIIANIENKKTYNLYMNAEKKSSDLKEKHKRTLIEIDTIRKDIEDLKFEKSNSKIALEKINHYLQFIFFDRKRMVLKPTRNGSYEVWINNKKVMLSNLSVGERNIISLCYFFTKINENKDQNNKISKFIIIDDPISSFDSQNKMGMLSFLRSQFLNLFIEESSNKLLILTHDIYTTIQFSKVFEDIYNQKKGTIKKHITYELKNKCLNTINLKKYNQISHLISTASLFAFNDEYVEQYDSSIGNTLRRILEGYSTFNYKMGITDLFNSKDILKRIPKERVEYYVNRMYRLLLHGESHLEDFASSLGHLDNFSTINLNEKRNLAKDVLSFLFEIDPLFFERHINNINSISNNKVTQGTILKEIQRYKNLIST